MNRRCFLVPAKAPFSQTDSTTSMFAAGWQLVRKIITVVVVVLVIIGDIVWIWVGVVRQRLNILGGALDVTIGWSAVASLLFLPPAMVIAFVA